MFLSRHFDCVTKEKYNCGHRSEQGCLAGIEEQLKRKGGSVREEGSLEQGPQVGENCAPSLFRSRFHFMIFGKVKKKGHQHHAGLGERTRRKRTRNWTRVREEERERERGGNKNEDGDGTSGCTGTCQSSS